jgi:hypothetical protein
MLSLTAAISRPDEIFETDSGSNPARLLGGMITCSIIWINCCMPPATVNRRREICALQWNFHSYGKRLREGKPKRISPFHYLNGFVYHANWLHNLLITSSLGSLRL